MVTLVTRVRVVVTGAMPSVGVSVVAAVVTVVLVGFPVTTSRTGCLKPPVGVMVMVDMALELRATVAVDGEREIEKSEEGAAVMLRRTLPEDEEKEDEPPYAAEIV